MNINKMPPFVNYQDDLVNDPQGLPLSALFDKAIEDYDIDLINSMINNGYDVNQPAFIIVNNNIRERYPLIFAVIRGYTDMINILLNAGSNINYRDMNGMNSIMYAAKLGKVEILQILINDIHNVDLVNVINEYDYTNWTALMIACEYGNVEIIQILLDAGANVYFLNEGNPSAVDIAHSNGHINVVNMLMAIQKL
jgi:ankyrin repeat protein